MIKNKKYRVVLTCWDYGCSKPYMDKFIDMYDSFDEAMEAIEKSVHDELITLNDIESDNPREKVAIENSDGNIVGYDYPFRANFDGDNHCIVRFWDGDDYQNVTAYNIHTVDDWDGYYIYRGFEIYPNKKGNRFKVTSSNDYFGAMKHKFESALEWIDKWYL